MHANDGRSLVIRVKVTPDCSERGHPVLLVIPFEYQPNSNKQLTLGLQTSTGPRLLKISLAVFATSIHTPGSGYGKLIGHYRTFRVRDSVHRFMESWTCMNMNRNVPRILLSVITPTHSVVLNALRAGAQDRTKTSSTTPGNFRREQ